MIQIVFSVVYVLVFAVVIYRIAYRRGMDKDHARGQAVLDEIKGHFNAEIEARDKVHRKYELIYYVAGIFVGGFILWWILKFRE